MVDSGLGAMVATHIPAWQRLGLKLKNQSLQSAPIAPTSPTDTPLAGNAFRKRKVDSDDETVVTSFDSTKRFKHGAGSMSNSPASSRAGSESHSFSESRRKSVTFSADTKAEDGSSSKRLVQAAYAARLAQTEDGNSSGSTGKSRIGSTGKTTDKKQSHSSRLAQVENGTSNVMADARQTPAPGSVRDEATNHAGSSADAATQATTDGKQSTQQKSPKKPSNQPSSKAQAAQQKKKQDLAINYLKEYATARSSWKFNKKHQIVLLKTALDVDQLPVIYDEALKSYLEGMQGTESRQRLRTFAKEVIAAKDDVANNASLGEPVFQRAQLVLEALGSEDKDLVNAEATSKPSPERKEAPMSVQGAPTEVKSTTPDRTARDIQSNHETSANQAANGTNRKRRRRPRQRKKRDASSGSDSSSSSDTESDSDDSQG